MRTLLIRILSGAAAPVAPVLFGPEGGTIGRADTNTLVLSDPERSVSRLHARVEPDGDGQVLVNLGINPVLCNGTVLPTGARVPLAAGDQVRIGRFALSVEAEPAALQGRTQPMPSLPELDAPLDLSVPDLLLEDEDEEPLFDDMTGLPLPRRTPAVAPPPTPAPVSSPAPVPTFIRPAPGAEELLLAELLRGMGCAVPVWPTPVRAQDVAQVGAALRTAMLEALRQSPGLESAAAQARWFAMFEHAFQHGYATAAPDFDRTMVRP